MKPLMPKVPRVAGILGMAALLAGVRAETIRLAGPLSGSNHWTSQNEYVMTNFVFVLDGATLRIDPGTVVRGVKGSSTNDFGALFVCQGGKILAEGTASRPIIFTAENDDVQDPEDLPFPSRGLWGGVVLLGKARINHAVNVAGDTANPKYEIFEGLPNAIVNGQEVFRFGGGDDDDNSGVMRYVSIRHGGRALSQDKEINGLSLAGVGRGTKLEYVETYATADDGFEFFGGAVNTRYLVSAFNDDDAFDADMGYRGTNQFWFAIQSDDKRDKGGEFNGEPNERAPGDGVPAGDFAVYNATWIGAGAAAAGGGNDAFTLRRFARARIYNSVITDFNGQPVNGGAFATGAAPDLQDNVWFGFAKPDFSPASIFTPANHNDVTDPRLTGISRLLDGRLDPRPGEGSPALTGARAVEPGGFAWQVAYRGAFGPDDLWLNGWTALSQLGHTPAQGGTKVNVAGAIRGDVRWTFDKEYLMTNFVYVLKGATLTIEPGTVVRGVKGSSTNDFGALFVCQGGKLFALGEPHNPIIFTSENDDLLDPDDIPFPTRGLWGGIVLLGHARINHAANVAGDTSNPKYEIFEGLPDTIIDGQPLYRFGNNNDNDSSGVLRYVSIRYGGRALTQDKEINGLSLCGVGAGTTVEFVETFATADDGFEFFGGAVNTRYLVSAFNDDDAFDADMGFHGDNQFWLAIQNDDKRDEGGEFNGEPNERAPGDGVPQGDFRVFNGTWIGAGAAGGTGNDGFTLRRHSRARIYNSIITDFNGQPVNGGAFATGAAPELQDNLWFGFSKPEFKPETLFAAENRNEVADPRLGGISRSQNDGLDPRPLEGSPALTSTRTPPENGFFNPVAWKGAFRGMNWAADWTALSALGFLTGAGGGNPAPRPSAVVRPPPVAPVLAANAGAGGIQVRFVSATGVSYQFQSRPEVSGGAWVDEGAPVVGTGGEVVSTLSAGLSAGYIRVVAR